MEEETFESVVVTLPVWAINRLLEDSMERRTSGLEGEDVASLAAWIIVDYYEAEEDLDLEEEPYVP